MTKKSILISSPHHKELKKLSETYNLNYYKLVEEMIIYFKKTGINPTDPKNENPSKALRELDKRLISFLKVMERDILKPLRQEVYDYSKAQINQMNQIQKNHIKLIEGINKLNEYDNNRANKILAKIAKQEEVLIAIAELIDTKNKTGIVNRIKKTFE